MKLDNIKNSDTRFLDDQKTNDVDISIDSEQMDMVVSLLTTNLYSNKEASLVREITSNAWDAHVVAQNDNPILLSFDEDPSGNISLSIRDFGTGLDESEIDRVYKKLGTSTKTNDNNQIGGFGIGKFSALAYSETVEIFSYHNGIKYAYMMFKEGLKIKLPLLYKEETDEPNGLQIRVPIKSGDLSSFILGIREQLPYFENLIISNETRINALANLTEEFNSIRIKDFGNFKMNNLSANSGSCAFGEPKILLGKVLYPIDFKYLEKVFPKHHIYKEIDRIKTELGIKFDIGEIKVTPNREEIQYDIETAELILDRLEKAYEFLEDKIDNFVSRDIKDLEDYKNTLFHASIVQIEEGNDDFCFHIHFTSAMLSKITCRGVHYSKEFISTITDNSYYSFVMPLKCKANFTPNKFSIYSSNNISTNFSTIIRGDTAKTLGDCLFHSKDTFKKMEKEYFKTEMCKSTRCNNCIFEFPKSKYKFIGGVWSSYMERFRTYTKSSYRHYGSTKLFKKQDLPLIKTYFKEFVVPELEKMYANIKDINEDTLPEPWVKKYKEDANAKKKKIAGKGMFNCDIYRYSLNGSANSAKNSDDNSVEQISKMNQLVIFGEKNSEEINNLAELLYGDNYSYLSVTNKLFGTKPLHVSVIAIAKSKMNDLQGVSDNVISYEEFMKGENKTFANLASCLIISEDLGKHGGLDFLLLRENTLKFAELHLDKKTVKSIKEIVSYISKYKAMYNNNDSQLRKDIIEIAKKNKNLNYGLLNRYEEVRSTIKHLTKISKMKYYILSNPNNHVNMPSKHLDLLILENSMYQRTLKVKPSVVHKLKKDLYG